MTFTVTYRGADGAVRTEAVEAANRGECFAQMKARGVAVLGVKEDAATKNAKAAKGIGRAERVERIGEKKSISHSHNSIFSQFHNSTIKASVLLIAFIALAGGGVAWWWMRSPRTATLPVPEAPKKPAALPKEVKPAAAPKPMAIPEKKDYAKLDNIALRRLPESETNNLSDAQVQYWRMFHPYPPPDPKQQPKSTRGHYRIFKEKVNNDIAFVVSYEPGTMVIGNRSVGADFERRFLKSLETPIIVSDEDSEHDRTLKRAVIAAKIELKAAFDRGEDIGKIMDDTRDAIVQLGHYKAQLEKEAMKALRKEGATAEDAEDMVAAVNKMLEARGIAPIQLNSMSRIALKYQSMQRKEKEKKQ